MAPPITRSEVAKLLTRQLWSRMLASGNGGGRDGNAIWAAAQLGTPQTGRVAGSALCVVVRPGVAVRLWCRDGQCRHRSGHSRCDGARNIRHGVPGRPARGVARCRSAERQESGLCDPAKATASGARVSGSWTTGRAVRSPGPGVLAAGANDTAPIAGFDLHHAKGSMSGYRATARVTTLPPARGTGLITHAWLRPGAPFTAACTRSFVPRLA